MNEPDGSPVAIHEDVLASHLPGETILLHMDTKKYYRLNETAAAIWRALEEEAPPEAIVDQLVADFEVEADRARNAVERQIEELEAADLIARPGVER